jgi:AcrR family transcriptional regulator
VRGRELFSKRPYDEISIDDIADAVGVSKGLLYHYFDSKRRFYVEIVRDTLEEMRVVTEPDPRLSALEQLDASLDKYLDYVERHANAYEVLLRSGVGTDPEVEDLIEGQRLVVIQRVLRGLSLSEATPALRTALRAWIGFIDAACLDWLRHRDVDRATIRALLATSLESALLSVVQSGGAVDLALPFTAARTPEAQEPPPVSAPGRKTPAR